MNDRNYQNKFPNSGTLHLRQKRSEKAPDMGGDIELSNDVLMYILKELDKGANSVKLELSGWRRVGKGGNTFTSLKIAIPYDQRGDGRYQGNSQPDQGRPVQEYRNDERNYSERDYRDDRTVGGYRQQGSAPPQMDERRAVEPQRNPYGEQSRGDYRRGAPQPQAKTNFFPREEKRDPQEITKEFSRGDAPSNFRFNR